MKKTQDQPKKNDQRIRVTRQLIYEAFLNLLDHKPVQQISVKELCESAGINRSTFYLHYQDVYDLLQQTEDDLLQELASLLQQNAVINLEGPPDISQQFVSSIFDFVEKNRKLCAILLGPAGDKQFVGKIVEMGKVKCVDEYLSLYPQVTRKQAEVYYFFIAWGFIGLLQYMLGDANIPLRSIARSTQRLLRSSAHFFHEAD